MVVIYLLPMNTATNTESEEVTEATRRIPVQAMAALVYPKGRRVRLPLRLIFVAAFLSTIGCATASKPVAVEVETVGNLSASYHSIAVAPVKHDAPPELDQVVDTDEDAPGPVIAAPVEKIEAPETVAKVAHGF